MVIEDSKSYEFNLDMVSSHAERLLTNTNGLNSVNRGGTDGRTATIIRDNGSMEQSKQSRFHIGLIKSLL